MTGTDRGEVFARLALAGASGDGPVAFGAGLGPDVLHAAYRHGLFPLPAADAYQSAFNEARYADAAVLPGPADPHGTSDPGDPDEEYDPYALAWWSPDPRPVIAPGGVRLGHHLARRLRNRLEWWTTADRAFDRVVGACADGREQHWLTAELREALNELHRRGAAHSAEVWDGEELIGGVFGVSAGPVLSLDSMFHRRSDAARVAVADLARRFAAAGGRLLDAQWDGPHVRSLGAVPMPRSRYLAVLAEPAELGPLPDRAEPVRRLGTRARR
ncbi:leucyl/phenylalanyl-tRNA--protein transferase [Kitasatospora sp. NPDC004240]